MIGIHYVGRPSRAPRMVLGLIRRAMRRMTARYAAMARAAMADPAIHVAARDAVACPTCGAEDEQECMYGLSATRSGPDHRCGPSGEPLPARCYPGLVHTRRIVDYLATLGTSRPLDIRPFAKR